MAAHIAATFGSSGFDKRASHPTVGTYGKGQTIFAQGEPADAVFRVENGNVKLTVKSRSGKSAVIAVFQAGECFGVGCLRGEALHRTTATSIGDSSVTRVDKAIMQRRLRNEPALANLLIAYLLGRVGRSEDDQADQLLHSSEHRLARLLLLLSGFTGDSAHVVSLSEFDQGTLAQMVGTTRSRVSHFMNEFRKRGFIEYNGYLKVHKALLSFLEGSLNP
jgi:CRP-like cAMP-binding protein